MLTITDAASQWFRQELALPATGSGIRFFGKVYGKTEVHDGFSVGMTRDDSLDDAVATTLKDGVTYYIAEPDAWFFDHLAMQVDVAHDEPAYHFSER
ncbi:HesB/YadR/YfhF family protein [Lacticaseibacillus absianus]|uniref:HesB/YadR/YfhF family protein n=1 Tax=Lacticaseibacillus absianus TaxID=2729623 RepID=UPI0015CEBF4E|nr:iron-sulfur cluster biosynthesis protein [Lacticaseibacillus absianus]